MFCLWATLNPKQSFSLFQALLYWKTLFLYQVDIRPLLLREEVFISLSPSGKDPEGFPHFYPLFCLYKAAVLPTLASARISFELSKGLTVISFPHHDPNQKSKNR